MPYNAGDLKWGEQTLGTPSGTITWSADYLGNLTYDTSTFSPADFDAALMAAFDTWESVASVEFQMVASSSDSDVDILSGNIGGAAGVAQYSYTVNPGIGTIFDAAITFSSTLPWSPYGGSGGADFHAVALHEIGHIIGLGHVNDPTEIMNPVITSDALGTGDIAGAQFLYGRDAGDVPEPPGEGPEVPMTAALTGGDGGGGGGGAGLLVGLLAALMALIFGGGAMAGAAIAAGRVADEDDDTEPADRDDSWHDTDPAGVTEHVHASYLADMPLPGIPVDQAASPCGCFGPCNCLQDQAYAVELLA